MSFYRMSEVGKLTNRSVSSVYGIVKKLGLTTVEVPGLKQGTMAKAIQGADLDRLHAALMQSKRVNKKPRRNEPEVVPGAAVSVGPDDGLYALLIQRAGEYDRKAEQCRTLAELVKGDKL